MVKAGKGDLLFSGFWLLVGLYVAAVSYSLGLGTVQTPGAGFMPFFFGLLLSAFSLANLVSRFNQDRGKDSPTSTQGYSRGTYTRIAILICFLVAYGIFVESIGFLIVTALVLAALFRVAGCTWTVSAIWGPVIACLSYFIFTYLGVMLPAGIIRF